MVTRERITIRALAKKKRSRRHHSSSWSSSSGSDSDSDSSDTRMDISVEVKEEGVQYRSVYLALMEEPLQWYRIEPMLMNTASRGGLVPVGRHALDDGSELPPSGFTCIPCGSKLYAIGGGGGGGGGSGASNFQYFSGNKDILVFDPASSYIDNGDTFPWKKSHLQLLHNRFGPGLAVKDDKIYIFGTYVLGGIPLPRPWCEVFDTNFGTIEALPDPPEELHNLTWDMGDVAVYNNQILIEADGHCFTFNTGTGKWGDEIAKLHPEIPNLCISTVVVHGFLIAVSRGITSAYDLDNKICIQPIPGFEDVFTPKAIWEAKEGCVMDLGNGKLCIVWSTPKHCLLPKDHLNVVTFELIKTVFGDGLPQLSAKIISSARYQVPGPLNISGIAAVGTGDGCGAGDSVEDMELI